MERRRISPGTSTVSIDSWDMENVNFLRKFSSATTTTTPPGLGGAIQTPGRNEHFASDEQFLHYDETVVISVNPNSNERRSMGDVMGVEISSDSAEVYSGQKSNDLDKYSMGIEPLDDCYLLDVVTVRNESVLASRISPMSKPRMGSDGYETASSVGSSIDEPSVFHPDIQGIDSGESCSEDYNGRSSFISEVPEQKITTIQRPTSSCPYCGELISITSCSTAYGDIYAGNTIQKNTETVLQPTLDSEEGEGDCSDSSPYYVRLRRDLYLQTCNSPLIKTPNNFSVDQQGQLSIDYKANWDGLEKYIQSLKMCN